MEEEKPAWINYQRTTSIEFQNIFGKRKYLRLIEGFIPFSKNQIVEEKDKRTYRIKKERTVLLDQGDESRHVIERYNARETLESTIKNIKNN